MSLTMTNKPPGSKPRRRGRKNIQRVDVEVESEGSKICRKNENGVYLGTTKVQIPTPAKLRIRAWIEVACCREKKRTVWRAAWHTGALVAGISSHGFGVSDKFCPAFSRRAEALADAAWRILDDFEEQLLRATSDHVRAALRQALVRVRIFMDRHEIDLPPSRIEPRSTALIPAEHGMAGMFGRGVESRKDLAAEDLSAPLSAAEKKSCCTARR